MIRVVLLVGAALGISAALGAAAPPPSSAVTASSAVIIRVSVPEREAVSLAEVTWPTSPSAEIESFRFPADGSIVSVGRSRASVSVQSDVATTAQSFAEAIALSVFDGAISAAKVTAAVSAGASTRSAGTDVSRSEVQGLRVLGQDVAASPGATVAVGGWGWLTVLSRDTGSRQVGTPATQGAVVALRIVLAEPRSGLPAGTEIVVGSAQAVAVAPPSGESRPARPAAEPQTGPAQRPERPLLPRAPEPDAASETVPGGPVQVPPQVSAALSSRGYVFPVYGLTSFGDSFGAPRSNAPGGWHHGEDVFALVGTPLLAVAEGVLHTIGFNKIGGYRLWLRDQDGNQFYYAHLSAYSPLAVEGRTVEAGDVIGFVGDSGDADGGLPHLHFEIHPAAMLGLGYDGVIAPYPILLAWRRAEDVSFAAGRIYVPSGPGGPKAPPPGAVLLQADDIASRSGLVPGALESALSR